MSSESRRIPVTRRNFLRSTAGLAGLAATGALLEACSSGTGTGTTTGPTGTGASTTTTPSGVKPVKGGTLTVGMTGGSSSDTIDGFNFITNVDLARTTPLNEPLALFAPNGEVVNRLAEEFSPNADGTVWTVRLLQGLTFHNGKPITAEDVIFSFQYMLNPKKPTAGAAAVLAVDPHGFKKLDNRTVQIKMLYPQITLRQQMTGGEYPIVPTDYNPKKPVGAGAFKLESFTPGQRSTLVRFADYYQSPLPYLDSVVLVDFPDSTSQVNALIGGQVDAIGAIPAVSARELAATPNVTVLNERSGQYLEQCMRCDAAPFNDVRVRQAMRLLVDRPQYVTNIFNGEAILGNDIFARFDADYNSELPQRVQDLPQAKSLLKAAGRLDYAFSVISGPWTAGQLESAELIAQQASAAGVKINVANTPLGTFLADDYTKSPFASGYWYDTPYAAQLPITMIKQSTQNETHWADPEWNALWTQLNKTADPVKYKDIVHQMQAIEYERGGYIIAAFGNEIDAVKSNVHGFEGKHTTGVLQAFHFEPVWIG